MAVHYAPGRYVCRVVSQALGEASTGNPQFVLRFKVLGVPDPDDDSRFIPDRNQYERTCYRTITDKTIEYFIEDLKILGFSKDSFKYLDPNTPGFHDFRGHDLDMFCNHENGQDGQPREKWGIAWSGGELQVKPLEQKKVRELDNLFGKHLKGMPAAAAAATAAPPAAEAKSTSPSPYITDDDVPF